MLSIKLKNQKNCMLNDISINSNDSYKEYYMINIKNGYYDSDQSIIEDPYVQKPVIINADFYFKKL